MPTPPGSPQTPPEAPLFAAGYTLKLLFFTAVLGLLYLGREILIPITLAVVLSLAIAPAVRWLKRLGLGQAPAVLSAVCLLGLLLAGISTLIAFQAMELGENFPQYQMTLDAKVDALRQATVGRAEAMPGPAGRLLGEFLGSGASSTAAQTGLPNTPAQVPPGVVAVQIQQPPATPTQLAAQVLGTLWGPIGIVGVVLIVLLFVLLEHESLRDRFIHLAGGTDIRAATYAFNDAGQRLSRFFVSQFALNLGVGAVIGLGLSAIGVPHGVFFAVVTAVLRFVPYVGVVAAALGATVLAAAVEPGWTMVLWTLLLFAVVEIVVAYAIEPQLYGHSTGLSPLSVVLAAIFWSWIWGPMGLLVSTPLTLCLVVAGRHVKALAFLDVLLGPASPLSLAQKFYQRALSGDAVEITDAARRFLKTQSFATYCDQVLMPALQLSAVDLASGKINTTQERAFRHAVVQAIEALSMQGSPVAGKRRPVSVLDGVNVGLALRQLREQQVGQWQGPLAVPPGSLVLCQGAHTSRSDFVAEIVARVLRTQRIDARSFGVDALDQPPPPGAQPQSVALVFIAVSLLETEAPFCLALTARVRERFPQATVVGWFSPHSGADIAVWTALGFDFAVLSFEQASQYAAARFDQRAAATAPESGLDADRS